MTEVLGGVPRSHDPVKSLSVIYHVCQMRLEMIIEGDLNFRALQFARPLILAKSENISVSLPKDGQYVPMWEGKESASRSVGVRLQRLWRHHDLCCVSLLQDRQIGSALSMLFSLFRFTLFSSLHLTPPLIQPCISLSPFPYHLPLPSLSSCPFFIVRV